MPAITGTPGDDILTGTDSPDTISGLGGNDTLYGMGGDDIIDGGDGNDLIDGGTGMDTMSGGTGNDTFFADVVIENDSEGLDTIYTSVNYTLPANVERLFVNGVTTAYAVNLTGNTLANEITGNDGANIIDGGAGNDIMSGKGGDDIYFVDSLQDQVVEQAGGGNDLIYTTTFFDLSEKAPQVERIAVFDPASTPALRLDGNALDNELWGNAGDNRIDGGTGADIMHGRAGNDIYQVDNVGDLVVEHAGEGAFDEVFTTIDYVLPDNVEWLAATFDNNSTRGLRLTGNEADNLIDGSENSDVIDGRGGADQMNGLGGDDIYYVDNVGDTIIEQQLTPSGAPGGIDTVWTTVSFSLPNRGSDPHPADFVERLGVNGFTTTFAIDLTGNRHDNEIWGNAGANVLDGKGGADILHGNGGADTFAFTSTLDNFNVDQLIGFTVGEDKIALDHTIFIGLGLGALAPSAFAVGTAESHGDARIIYNSMTGGIYFDADGSDTGVAVQFATVHEGLALSASDFQVI